MKVNMIFKIQEIQYKLIRFLSYNIVPIVALFAIKLNADILLYHIAKDIIFIHKAKNWSENLFLHLQYFTNNYFLAKSIKSFVQIFEENQFYFSLLNISEENIKNKNVFNNSKNNNLYFVDLFKIHSFVKENIFDKNVCFIPSENLEYYFPYRQKNNLNVENQQENNNFGLIKPNVLNRKNTFKAFS